MKFKLLALLLAPFGVVVVYQAPSCAAPEVVKAPAAIGAPNFDGRDTARQRIAIELVPVVTGIDQPTDIQAVPGQPGLLALLSKGGQAYLAEPGAGTVQPWFQVAVNTRSETPFRYYTTDTPFEYDVLRFAYTKARALQGQD